MQVSIWEKETFFENQDLIIIGSGFVGLWSAILIKESNPSMKITVLERGLIPSGASTRNAGFACFGSLTEVMADSRSMGMEKMLELVELRHRGLSRIRKYFKNKEIDYRDFGGYELIGARENVSEEQLQTDITYINSLLKPVTKNKSTYRLANNKIDEFGFGGTSHLVLNKLEGGLHSGKLLRGLLRLAQSMGITIFNSVNVKNYERVGEHFEVRTEDQQIFHSKKILLCTNAFTKKFFPEEDIIPARGQVLLTSPIDDLPFEGTFHAEEGYYYFRNLGKRVLLGGARHKAFDNERTDTMETSEEIQEHLHYYLHNVILPKHEGKYSIEMRWSGIMAMGTEKLPLIKELEPDVFCAVRMSGMGVALAPVVGGLINKLISS